MKLLGAETEVWANYFSLVTSKPVWNYSPCNEGLNLDHCSVKALGPLLFGFVIYFNVISLISFDATNSSSKYLSNFSFVSL